MIRRLLSSLLLGAAVLSGIALAPLSASAVNTCASYDFDIDYSVFTGKRVVLVLHGWTGKSQGETAAMLEDRLPAEDWVVLPFAYESSNKVWPEVESAAVTCLRQVISQYGAATELPGPSVYLVGHSMGGILSRFALDRDYRIQSGQLVAGVITVDTPHKGSPWGSSILATLAQTKASVSEWVEDVWNAVRGRSWAGSASSDGSSAADCLALHHPGFLAGECAPPPAISADIPVHQIAGDVTLTRQFFMFARQSLDTESDGIVWLGSQVGHSTSVDAPLPEASQASSSVVRCDYRYAALAGGIGAVLDDDMTDWIDGPIAAAIQSGTTSFRSYRSATALLFGAAMYAPCGHMSIMTNPEAMDSVSEKLVGWAQSAAGEESVSELLIPAGACTQWEGSRPIQLSSGQGENFDAGQSGTGILSTQLVGRADLNGDGADDTVLVIECTGTPIASCCAGRSSIQASVIALDLSGVDPALIGQPINGGDPMTFNGDNDAYIYDDGSDAPRLDGTDILTSEGPIYPEQLSADEAAEITGWFRHALVDGKWTREREED